MKVFEQNEYKLIRCTNIKINKSLTHLRGCNLFQYISHCPIRTVWLFWSLSVNPITGHAHVSCMFALGRTDSPERNAFEVFVRIVFWSPAPPLRAESHRVSFSGVRYAGQKKEAVFEAEEILALYWPRAVVALLHAVRVVSEWIIIFKYRCVGKRHFHRRALSFLYRGCLHFWMPLPASPKRYPAAKKRSRGKKRWPFLARRTHTFHQVISILLFSPPLYLSSWSHKSGARTHTKSIPENNASVKLSSP